MLSFGAYLKRKRIELGFTQQQIADAMGITRQSMAQYEKVIEKQKGSRKVVPPGVNAEYGYLLIKSGIAFSSLDFFINSFSSFISFNK